MKIKVARRLKVDRVLIFRIYGLSDAERERVRLAKDVKITAHNGRERKRERKNGRAPLFTKVTNEGIYNNTENVAVTAVYMAVLSSRR